MPAPEGKTCNPIILPMLESLPRESQAELSIYTDGSAQREKQPDGGADGEAAKAGWGFVVVEWRDQAQVPALKCCGKVIVDRKHEGFLGAVAFTNNTGE